MPKIDTCSFIWKEGSRYPAQDEMVYPQGIEHILAHDGRKDIMTFVHDVAIASYQDRLYISWYNSTDAEICGTSLIRGRFSRDSGKSWQEPFLIAGNVDSINHHFVPSNFFNYNGEFYAIITEMTGKNATYCVDLFKRHRGNDEKWDKVAQIGGPFICNAPPKRLPDGNWILGAWTPRKNDTPSFPAVLISQGDDITKEWKCHFFYDPLKPDGVRIRCPEVALHVENETVTAYIRNDEGPSYVFESFDCGKSWSAPMFNPMNIGRSKIFADVLSDGRKFIVYNEYLESGSLNKHDKTETRVKNISQLVIALAEPGERAFSKVWRLFNGFEKLLSGRGDSWWYPCTTEYKGHFYVACTLQEHDSVRSVVIAKVPIESL